MIKKNSTKFKKKNKQFHSIKKGGRGKKKSILNRILIRRQENVTLALCSRFKHGTTENDLSSAVQKTANDKHLEDINDPARKQQKQKLVKKNKEK